MKSRSTKAKGGEHPLHSLSSYLGSFPPRTAREILNKWVPARASVLDPFCGSGTTLLEAKLSGRKSLGIDKNPLAVAITAAKMSEVDLPSVMYRITELAAGFQGASPFDDVPRALEPIFHPRTLAQLFYLRGALKDDSPEDAFIRGCILGIMHGKGRKTGGTSYLSVDMPNTFSMSPDYVRKYAAANHLVVPPVDVFAKVRDRAEWLLRSGSLPSDPRAHVVEGDATQVHSLLPEIGVKSVGAIVTSPPYLGILRYGAFNWIRLWFLNHEPADVDRQLDSTDSLDRYLSFMASFFASSAKVLRPDGVLVCVIGDVVERGQHLSLANRVWQEIGDLVPFECLHISADEYDARSKTTRVWGETKKGRATPLDRVLVLRRVPRLRR
jgi:SAM-dependent methyltransferase